MEKFCIFHCFNNSTVRKAGMGNPFGFVMGTLQNVHNESLRSKMFDNEATRNHVQKSDSGDLQASLFVTYNVASLVGAILMALLCVIGFYGNVVSIAIFGQPPMRSSVNVLLSGVSGIDLAVLLFSVPVFVLPTLDQYAKFEFIQTCYSFSLLVVYPMAMMARTASVWTFVLITVERYFAVCYPLDVDKTMTPGRAKSAQATVVVLSIFYNLVRFWEYRPNSGDFPTRRSADQVTPLLRANDHYFVIYYTALYMITNFVFPFFLILVLNMRILASIRRAYYERCSMNGQQRNRYRTSRMIVVVTVMFGVCNVFSFALSVWELCDTGLFESQRAEYGYLLLDVSNIAIILNSSMTFVIFLVYCKKYRRFFAWFFRCGCLARKKTGYYNGRYQLTTTGGATVEDNFHYDRAHRHALIVRNYRSVAMLKIDNSEYATFNNSTNVISVVTNSSPALHRKSSGGAAESGDKEMDALLPTPALPVV